MTIPFSIAASAGSLIRRMFGLTKRIGEEEFKTFRRESLDPVTRSGVCYVPMPGFESTAHYRDKQNLHHLGRYEWSVRASKDLPRKARVLDSACGVGYWQPEIGIHLRPRRCSRPVRSGDRDGQGSLTDHPNIDWHCLDVDKLSDVFSPESFDAIVRRQTIESIEADDKYLDDLRDLLVPGGVLLIDTPIRENARRSPGEPSSPSLLQRRRMDREAKHTVRNQSVWKPS